MWSGDSRDIPHLAEEAEETFFRRFNAEDARPATPGQIGNDARAKCNQEIAAAQAKHADLQKTVALASAQRDLTSD